MVPVLADVGSVSVNVGAARGAPLGPVPLRTVIVAVWAVLPATVSTNVTLSNQWPAVRTVVTLALLPVAGKGAVRKGGGGGRRGPPGAGAGVCNGIVGVLGVWLFTPRIRVV